MAIASDTPTLAQWKLRRLANRALRVLAQHRNASPMIAGYETSLPAAVESFEQKQSELAMQDAATRQLSHGGYQEAELLLRAMRGWLALVARDVPGFDTAEFIARASVPDDVITQAFRLIEFVKRRQAEAPIACGDQVLANLAPLAASARQEWEQVQSALARTQEVRSECREAGVALQAQLVAFRRSLRAALGGTHRDYQLLRASRMIGEAGNDEDSDEADDSDDAEDESDEAEVEETAVTPPLPRPPQPAVVSSGTATNSTATNGTASRGHVA